MSRKFKVQLFSIILILMILDACTWIDPLINRFNGLKSPDQGKVLEGHPEQTQFPQLSPETELHVTPRSPSSDQRHPQYWLDIELDYEQKTLLVTQVIIYTNNSGEPLIEIPLIIPPDKYSGAFELLSLQINAAIAEMDGQITDQIMTVPLFSHLEQGDFVEITLKYQLYLPQQTGAFGYTDRQILLADWYPFVPPLEGEQLWLINTPGPVGEYLVYPLSDFNINFCIIKSESDLIIAASAPVTFFEEGCYQYEVKNRRNFSLGISPDYHKSTATNDVVEIEVFTFPEHAGLAGRAANLAIQAWETFTDIFGDNQRQHLSIVEAEIDDGLEKDGLFYLSDWYFESADRSPRNYLTLLIVHETTHQWFYGWVHNDQAHHPWLDEAVATYSELLFIEQHHPELVDWWWQFRVTDFNPRGYVNSTIYDFRRFRPYVNAVYLRGALFLQSLREQIGDQAFFEFLLAYSQIGEEDFIRTTSFFFALLQQYTNEEMTTLRDEFFR